MMQHRILEPNELVLGCMLNALVGNGCVEEALQLRMVLAIPHPLSRMGALPVGPRTGAMRVLAGSLKSMGSRTLTMMVSMGRWVGTMIVLAGHAGQHVLSILSIFGIIHCIYLYTWKIYLVNTWKTYLLHTWKHIL